MGRMIRGVRGAIQVKENLEEEIIEGAAKLLREILEENGIESEDIAAIIFTTTQDLNAAFPAEAARKMGFDDVPLLCASEISVPSAMGRVIRILLLWNTDKSQKEVKHIYVGETKKLKKEER